MTRAARRRGASVERKETETPNEIRKRLVDLARILEKHNVAWTYDLLIDLDLYMTWPGHRRQHDLTQ
jgi:hypothetical protein